MKRDFCFQRHIEALFSSYNFFFFKQKNKFINITCFGILNNNVFNQYSEVLLLTWYPVNCFERSQYPHCPDGSEVDILQVQRVFNHPETNKHTHKQTEGPVNNVNTSGFMQLL